MNDDKDIFTIGDALAASDNKPKQRKKTKSSTSESTTSTAKETKPKKKKSPTVVEKTLVDEEQTIDLSNESVEAKLATSEKVSVKAKFKDDADGEKSDKFEKDMSDLIKNAGMKDEYPMRKIDDEINGKKSKTTVVKNVGIGTAIVAGIAMLVGFLLKDN